MLGSGSSRGQGYIEVKAVKGKEKVEIGQRLKSRSKQGNFKVR